MKAWQRGKRHGTSGRIAEGRTRRLSRSGFSGGAATLGIVIPHGEFRINSAISVNKSYVTIRGMGCGSKLVMGTGLQQGILVPNDTTRISGLTIRDLRIVGTDWGVPQIGIYIDRPNDGSHLNSVTCTNLRTGIYIREADASRIVGCTLAQCESALRMSGGLNAVVARNHFGGYSGGITVELAGINRVQFTGNVIMPDGYTCLWLRGSDNCNISGNNITTWYTGAIEVEGNMNSLIANNISAVQVNSQWLADPRTRDGLYGLIASRATTTSALPAQSCLGSPWTTFA